MYQPKVSEGAAAHWSVNFITRVSVLLMQLGINLADTVFFVITWALVFLSLQRDQGVGHTVLQSGRKIRILLRYHWKHAVSNKRILVW